MEVLVRSEQSQRGLARAGGTWDWGTQGVSADADAVRTGPKTQASEGEAPREGAAEPAEPAEPGGPRWGPPPAACAVAGPDGFV